MERHNALRERERDAAEVMEKLRRRRAVLAAENARELAAFKIQWWWIGLWKVRGSPVKRWAALQPPGEEDSFSPDLKDYSAEISKMLREDGRFSPSAPSPAFEDFAGQLSEILSGVDFVEGKEEREQLDSIKYRFDRQRSESPSRRFEKVVEEATAVAAAAAAELSPILKQPVDRDRLYELGVDGDVGLTEATASTSTAAGGSFDDASRSRLGELGRLHSILNPGVEALVTPPRSDWRRLQEEASGSQSGSTLRYTRGGVVGKAPPRSRHHHSNKSPDFQPRQRSGAESSLGWKVGTAVQQATTTVAKAPLVAPIAAKAPSPVGKKGGFEVVMVEGVPQWRVTRAPSPAKARAVVTGSQRVVNTIARLTAEEDAFPLRPEV